MTVEEAVRLLGKCIQEDERYLRYKKAKQDNDNDEDLQNLISEFNIKRMNYDMLSKKDNPDAEKLQKYETELDSIYEDILSNENMKRFQYAKSEMDAMTKNIDSIITLCLQGEDPETCHPDLSNCSGNCSACGGCH
ncbi:MAG: YlbF family regulator [Ruminococcus sp.]|nr:YlbF family regulator [Ruminococcus sp.]